MWWWRKRKWDCVSGINSYITDKKKEKERWTFKRPLARQGTVNGQENSQLQVKGKDQRDKKEFQSYLTEYTSKRHIYCAHLNSKEKNRKQNDIIKSLLTCLLILPVTQLPINSNQ